MDSRIFVNMLKSIQQIQTPLNTVYFSEFNLNFLQSPLAQIQILLSVIFAGIIYYLISILVNQKLYSVLAKVISKKWFITNDTVII